MMPFFQAHELGQILRYASPFLLIACKEDFPVFGKQATQEIDGGQLPLFGRSDAFSLQNLVTQVE
jgi:hypothetical protein